MYYNASIETHSLSSQLIKKHPNVYTTQKISGRFGFAVVLIIFQYKTKVHDTDLLLINIHLHPTLVISHTNFMVTGLNFKSFFFIINLTGFSLKVLISDMMLFVTDTKKIIL